DLLRVVEQPANQRRLAVVDRPARNQAQQLGRRDGAGQDICCGGHGGTPSGPRGGTRSEGAGTPAGLPRRLWSAGVPPGLAALGDPGRRDLGDDLLQRACLRANTPGARHVPDGTEANGGDERLLVRVALDELRGGVEHAVAREDLAFVREVDGRQLELLSGNVLPDVELGPVRDREAAHLLALADLAVVEVPELRPLGTRIPLTEVVAEREDPLLRARALLVAAGAADRGVVSVLDHRVEQRRRLQLVPRRARACL